MGTKCSEVGCLVVVVVVVVVVVLVVVVVPGTMAGRSRVTATSSSTGARIALSLALPCSPLFSLALPGGTPYFASRSPSRRYGCVLGLVYESPVSRGAFECDRLMLIDA
jgi:hypothetical protein